MMQLDHTIIPVKNQEMAAELMAKLFGLPKPETIGHFSALKINDSLTFDFVNSEQIPSHHYAFWVDQNTFNETLKRLKDANITIGSAPFKRDGMIGERNNSNHFYFFDPDGHNWELMVKVT